MPVIKEPSPRNEYPTKICQTLKILSTSVRQFQSIIRELEFEPQEREMLF